MEIRTCEECGFDYEVRVPKFCGRDCFHKNYGKNHRSEKHYKWKGEEVGYAGIHQWLNKQYGLRGKCDHCGKTGKLHWAKITGKEYKRLRENFKHLCPSCHKLYDMTDETRKKMSLSRIGKPSNAGKKI